MGAVAADEKTEKKGENFTTALATRLDDIAPLLPKHISKERFSAAAHAAVKQNPDLLNCSVRSLFNAFTKAAQDGLLPDGREGIINSYNTKTEVNGKEIYVLTAQWSPMTYGIRKRARELDGIIIDAQVVNKADRFERQQGDDPKIIHIPAPMDEDPGQMVGAYAIFKREDGTILHRETMRAPEIEATREQSRAKKSLMWTTFATEGWRKAVVRRGSKTVPVSEKLQALIERDDEAFDFNQDRPQIRLVSQSSLTPPPAPPPASPAIEVKPELSTVPEPTLSPESAAISADEERALDRAAMSGEPQDQLAAWMDERIEEANVSGNIKILDEIDDEVCATLDTANRDDQRQRWNKAYNARKANLSKAHK